MTDKEFVNMIYEAQILINKHFEQSGTLSPKQFEQLWEKNFSLLPIHKKDDDDTTRYTYYIHYLMLEKIAAAAKPSSEELLQEQLRKFPRTYH